MTVFDDDEEWTLVTERPDLATLRGLSALERRLLVLRERFGMAGPLILLTVISILGSLLLCVLILAVLLGTEGFHNPYYFVLSTLIPGIVAPVLSRYTIGVLDVLSQVNEEQTQLAISYRALASHDELTGVLNRRGLFEADQVQSGTTVLLADVDAFKSVNDEHGHAVGTRSWSLSPGPCAPWPARQARWPAPAAMSSWSCSRPVSRPQLCTGCRWQSPTAST